MATDHVRELDEAFASQGVSASDVRAWLVEYLEMYAEETERFPSEAGLDHWDMLVFDEGRADAPFVLAFFTSSDVRLLIGRDDAAALRQFGESGFPEAASEVPTAVQERFHVEQRVSCSVGELKAWLGE